MQKYLQSMAWSPNNRVGLFNFHSFKTKLVFAASIPVLLGLGLGAALDIQDGQRQLSLSTDINTDLIAEQTSQTLAGPMWDFDEVLVDAILQSVLRVPSIQNIRLSSPLAEDVVLTREMDFDKANYRTIVSPVVYDSNKESQILGQLELTFSTAEMQNVVLAMTKRKLTLTFVVASFVGIALFIILGRLSAPLEKLRETIQKIRDGDLHGPVPGTEQADEIGALALAIDDLRQKEIELVTLRKETDEVARQKAKRIQRALQSTSDAVAIFDEHGRVAFLNENAATLFPQLKLGLIPSKKMGLEIETNKTLRSALIDQKAFEGQMNISLNNEVRHLQVRASRIDDTKRGSLGLLLIATDMTEEVKSAKIAEFLSTHDALTELGNRRVLESCFDLPQTGPNNSSAIMLADLDHFKQINDTLGHPVGDQVLKFVAELLKKHSTNAIHTPVRLGGDEFAVFATGEGAERSLVELGEKLVELLGSKSQINEKRLTISMSIGVGSMPAEEFNVSEILRRADLALYKAKRGGRARLELYDEQLDQALHRRSSLIKEIDTALANGEIYAEYQVQTNLETDDIYGFEALARWSSPKFGKFSPAEFIPLAESSSKIEALTISILEESCFAAVRMRANGFSGRISVNFSSVLFDGRAQSILSNVLEKTNCPPDAITIEITETVLLKKSDAIQNEFNAIRQLGVTVAIDDFGTGFSSLSYLTVFQVDI
ncbi:MAG: diguanylate cyclase (GGDEF)-like protein, partial [Yoonia sp.]